MEAQEHQQVRSGKDGSSFTISSTIPTKSGYLFSGWGLDKNSNSSAFVPGYSGYFNANIDLYALWTPLSKCSKLIAPFGTDNSWKETTVTLKSGHGISLYIDGVMAGRDVDIFVQIILSRFVYETNDGAWANTINVTNDNILFYNFNANTEELTVEIRAHYHGSSTITVYYNIY